MKAEGGTLHKLQHHHHDESDPDGKENNQKEKSQKRECQGKTKFHLCKSGQECSSSNAVEVGNNTPSIKREHG